jgi:hypothetical protein
MQARERGADRNKIKKHSKQRKKFLQSLTGEPDMKFYSESLKSSLTTEQLLAMEHLKLLKTLNKLKEEEESLTRILHQDCDNTELKFAPIAMRRSQERALSRARTASFDQSSSPGPSSLDFEGSGGWPQSDGEIRSTESRNNSLSWGPLSSSKIDTSRSRQWKRMDMTVYAADGKWNESGQFVPARKPEDKLGLMSAKYARITGDAAPEILTRRRKTDIFKMEMTS